MTDYFRELDYGGDLYTENSPILSVQPPQQTSSVDSQTYAVNIADPEFAFKDVAPALVGKFAEVNICLISNGTPVIELGYAPITVYRGRIAGTSYKISSAMVGDVILQIDCASPMGNLDLVKAFHTNKTFMQQKINAKDTCFDQIYEGSGAVRLRWGK